MSSLNPHSVKLTDTQLVILSAAAQREDRRVIAPEHLKGAIAQRLLNILQSKGLIIPGGGEDASALVLSDLALQVLGIDQASVANGSDLSKDDDGVGSTESAIPIKAPRQGSKLDTVLAMLTAPAGATIDELMATTGWLPHTTRAALTGLRKRGITVELQKGKDGELTRYRSPQPPASAPDEDMVTEEAA